MTQNHPDLVVEQNYLDQAHSLLARGHADTETTIASFVPSDRASAAALQRALDIIRDSRGTGSLIFGRADSLDGSLYIGRRRVYNENKDLRVISWHTPAAAPFYQATPEEPCGLLLKRTIIEEDRRIVRLIDEIVAATASEVTTGTPAAFGDALLAELERSRDGAMRDVIATIQAEQYRIIRSEAQGTVVVQGGPGTGKTVVGLHRAAWLAYNHEDLRRRGMLIVAPTTTLLTYISGVLPLLGVTDVMQVHLPALYAGGTTATRGEALVAEGVKGSRQMAYLLRNALSNRINTSPDDIAFSVGADRIRIPADQVRDLVVDVQSRNIPHNEARDLLRQTLAQTAHREYAIHQKEMGRPAVATESTIRRLTTFTNALDRLWPRFTPEDLLRSLYGTQSWLIEASQDVLSADERAALYREPAAAIADESWSNADIYCLDELSSMLDGPPVPYGHIVVDEAQDLSPMQARALSRRCPTGSFTLLGDLAQATGPWVRDSWDELLAHIDAPSHTVETLTIGYRVPAAALDLAARQLPLISPLLTAPQSIRPGRREPTILRAAPEVVAIEVGLLIHSLLSESLTTAVVVDDSVYDRWLAELRMNNIPVGDGRDGSFAGSCTLVPATLTKGLEFDAVVVVEPDEIVRSSSQGRRILYVAMTRCTQELHLVHTQPLPLGLDHLDLPETTAVDVESSNSTSSGAPRSHLEATSPNEHLLDAVTARLRTLSDTDLLLVASIVDRLSPHHSRQDQM